MVLNQKVNSQLLISLFSLVGVIMARADELEVEMEMIDEPPPGYQQPNREERDLGIGHAPIHHARPIHHPVHHAPVHHAPVHHAPLVHHAPAPYAPPPAPYVPPVNYFLILSLRSSPSYPLYYMIQG